LLVEGDKDQQMPQYHFWNKPIQPTSPIVCEGWGEPDEPEDNPWTDNSASRSEISWTNRSETLCTYNDDIGTEYWCTTKWLLEEGCPVEQLPLYDVNAIVEEVLEEEEEEVNVWKDCDTRMFPVLGDEDDATPSTVDQDMLTTVQEEALNEILEEFADIFTTDLKNRPRCQIAKHRINTEDAEPIKCRPYRYSP
jgi:hypothetical protein